MLKIFLHPSAFFIKLNIYSALFVFLSEHFVRLWNYEQYQCCVSCGHASRYHIIKTKTKICRRKTICFTWNIRKNLEKVLKTSKTRYFTWNIRESLEKALKTPKNDSNRCKSVEKTQKSNKSNIKKQQAYKLLFLPWKHKANQSVWNS